LREFIDADDEPSLGASDGANQERTWSLRQNSADDREEQNEDGDELDKLEVNHPSDRLIAACRRSAGGCPTRRRIAGGWRLTSNTTRLTRRRGKVWILTSTSGTTQRTALPTWMAWPSSVRNTLTLIFTWSDGRFYQHGKE
jgi:hypothetical protein